MAAGFNPLFGAPEISNRADYIEVTLDDAQADPKELLQLPETKKTFLFEYGLTRGEDARVGTIFICVKANAVETSEVTHETEDVGVDFRLEKVGTIVKVFYQTTATGAVSRMTYSLKGFA